MSRKSACQKLAIHGQEQSTVRHKLMITICACLKLAIHGQEQSTVRHKLMITRTSSMHTSGLHASLKMLAICHQGFQRVIVSKIRI